MQKVSNERDAGFEPLFARPAEAASMLRISRSKVYELIASGAIPSRRIGGSVRVPLAALREMAVAGTGTGDGSIA
ncbi:MAG TPA: helix-turn-helix domain-containing protein [Candidatus Binataceae bacterium]|nr:helix-turn-helix domain-containing protein [Candidatus Binataceae bacterium]